MNNKLKYYFGKTKTLPSEIAIKKSFRKVKNKGLSIIDKICANVFRTEMTDTEFLRKAWNLKYQFGNSEKLQKYFRERKKPKLFINSLKKEDTVSFIYEHFLGPRRFIDDKEDSGYSLAFSKKSPIYSLAY